MIKMKLLILSMLVAMSMAAPAAQSMTFHDDGSYRFYYETGKEGGSHSRSEFRNPDGVVIGKFSYEDPDGDLREVNYRADESGFVAQGDVGVKGAPKGQFPIAQEDPPQETTLASVTTVNDDQPAEPKQDGEQQQSQQQSEPQAEATQDEPYHDEEEDIDDMQDLALEESSDNNPPEAFPPGFFLGKFQGLRRLPEPTKEEKPATTEAPKEAEKLSQPPEEERVDEKKPAEPAASGPKPAEESAFFGPMKSFPGPGFSHPEWASAMFHQPVYVFAYNQPDSYGYHYYF